MTREVKKVDTIQDVTENDMIGLTRELLDKVVVSSGIKEQSNMDKDGARNAKIVLGYINAVNSTINTKIQIFKMVGLIDKVKAIKKRSSRL